ncbi:hypoxia-inducible factor 3-alpha-like [Watersipora subatra]|uniref:hypoxia-inducible factor 3-alpha-like n=1 Tax=Watersipora subatra TaxID=2589382 RepID=UPI00355C5D7D
MRQKSVDKRVQSEHRRQVRKEKSKEAARSRRGKEGEVFSDIIDILPVADNVKGALDKTSIIRLCINYIRSRHLLANVCLSSSDSDGNSELAAGEAADLLHGFLLIIAPAGDVIYVTSNVKQLLGLCEYDVIGRSLETFVHPGDCDELEQVLKSSSPILSFSIRFKSQLSPRARGHNFKSSAYKTLRFCGKRLMADVKPGNSGIPEYLVLTATPLDYPSPGKLPLDSMTFTSQHSLDMRVTDSDSQTSDLTHYSKSYLEGRSFYDFVHPADIKSVVASFKALSSKEHVMTDPYRFLINGGGEMNVYTEASITLDCKTGKPLHTICVHHVISQPVQSGVILAGVQSEESTIDQPQVIVKAEKVQHNFCDAIKHTAATGESPTLTDETYGFDDIFNSTSSVFMDPVEDSPSCLDIMRDTESIFGEDCTANCLGGEFTPTVTKGSTDSVLEELVEALDNQSVDMNRGPFVDRSEADEMDFFLRAPYIPMEDYLDVSIDGFGSKDGDQKGDNIGSYRKNDSLYSPANSSPSSISPAVESDNCTPADSPPWLSDGDTGDLISDLAELSYTERGRDCYNKSMHSSLSSLADLEEQCQERLVFTDAEVSPPTSQSIAGRPPFIMRNVPSGRDGARVPCRNQHKYVSSQGPQYEYARRKRKVTELYDLESLQVKMQREPDTCDAASAAYHLGRVKITNDKCGTQRSLANCISPNSSNYLAASKPPDKGLWNSWENGKQSSSQQMTSIPLNDGGNNNSLSLNGAKVASNSGAGWFSVSPVMCQSSSPTKYQPLLQKNAHPAHKNDKRATPKVADSSLLLHLLQQT